jgi:hypothetical protein
MATIHGTAVDLLFGELRGQLADFRKALAPFGAPAAARAVVDEAEGHRRAAMLLRARASLAGYDSATILRLERSAIDQETRALMLERGAGSG